MERDKSLERSWDNDAFNFFFVLTSDVSTHGYIDGECWPFISWPTWRKVLLNIRHFTARARPYIAPSNNKQELPQKYQPITSFYNLLLGLLLFDFRLINTFFVIFSVNLLPFRGFSPQYTAILSMEKIIFLYYKILSWRLVPLSLWKWGQNSHCTWRRLVWPHTFKKNILRCVGFCLYIYF